ncbi:MAG: hypothetical protein AAB883_00605 [Patescibacteria group bacterium]
MDGFETMPRFEVGQESFALVTPCEHKHFITWRPKHFFILQGAIEEIIPCVGTYLYQVRDTNFSAFPSDRIFTNEDMARKFMADLFFRENDTPIETSRVSMFSTEDEKAWRAKMYSEFLDDSSVVYADP